LVNCSKTTKIGGINYLNQKYTKMAKRKKKSFDRHMNPNDGSRRRQTQEHKSDKVYDRNKEREGLLKEIMEADESSGLYDTGDTFSLYDIVETKENIQYGSNTIPAGTRGTIVEISINNLCYDVEFKIGDKILILTVLPDSIKKVKDRVEDREDKDITNIENERIDKGIEDRIKATQELLLNKRAEYASGDKHRFHNFIKAAKVDGVHPARALHGMMMKHFVSYMDMLEEIEKNETIDVDKIKEKFGDLITYLILQEQIFLYDHHLKE